MNMFSAWDKAKPDTENIGDLNFASIKLTTAKVTKLPFKHKISKIDMIWFAKPGLTKDLHIVQNEEFSIIHVCYMCHTHT
jgi:hypothetical protein